MAKEVTRALNFLMVKTGSFDNLRKMSCVPNNLMSNLDHFWDEYEQFNNHIKNCEKWLENISFYHPHRTINFYFLNRVTSSFCLYVNIF